MERNRRSKRVLSFVLGLAAVLALSFSAVTPALAATNPTLGDLTAANPAANKYAGCVAAVLTGSGVTFGNTAALGADLAAIWSTLPAGLSAACRTAVDGNQPQVCVNPADPATCPAVGTAATTAAMDQAVGVTGTWKLVTDGVGIGGYAQTPIPAGVAAGTAIATTTGTFTTPADYCSYSSCAGLPGIFTDCGPTTCGGVTAMTVSVIGRTPNGENAVMAHFHIADGLGNVTDAVEVFGNGNSGAGCAAGDCTFNARLVWNCKDAAGLTANCGKQTLAVTFTFETGAVSPPPTLGQLVEFQLAADNVNLRQNPGVCPGIFDCLRYDDSRLSYLDGSGQPTVVEQLGATPPSAVIDLASSSLGCLINVNALKGAGAGCVDATGASAPLLQIAHPPIVAASPPSITATATPSGGWQRTPVTVTLSASDTGGAGVASITYSSSGAQTTPETVVAGSTAQIIVSADGTTLITYRATDAAGLTSGSSSISVQVDQTPATVSCATPATSWSATNVAVACSAADATSGLADPNQALLSLATTVPAGSETASATTGSATVCDLAGNCTTAGPVGGIKIDRLAPTIVITAPSGTYSLFQFVWVAYSCSDGGSGVASCIGSQASSSLLNTLVAGSYTFTVTATDAVGNTSRLSTSYTVAAMSCGGDEEGDHGGHWQGAWTASWMCENNPH